MKAVLISIKPKWVEKIASGKKTIEVRKTRPKIDTPFKCYIYCTYGNAKENYCLGKRGKVIGEFVCDKTDNYIFDQAFDESMGVYIDKFGYEITDYELCKTCLFYEELEKYGNTNMLYGWHISDLKIYDKPKILEDFYSRCNIPEDKCKLCDNCYVREDCYGREYAVKKLTRPPQSWCYVEV